MKQYIIVRKDLGMSKGRIAAQVAHASIMCLLKHGNWQGKNISFDKLPKDVLQCLSSG